MAEAVILPKQGNSVESCLIMAWKKQVGEAVQQGDVLVEVETDKAVVEVPSPADGTLLAQFFAAGDEVPVMTTIAVVGAAGEDAGGFAPGRAQPMQDAPTSQGERAEARPDAAASQVAPRRTTPPASAPAAGPLFVSPRARALAERYGVDLRTVTPSGPDGRVIERDVQAVLAAQQPLTPAARERAAQGDVVVPAKGSGIGGRVTVADLQAAPPEAPTQPASAEAAEPEPEPDAADYTEIPVRGIRKTIAERMLASTQQTASVTLNTSADARALQAYRQRLKHSDSRLGLQHITLNDLLMFAVSRVLLDYPNVNATYAEGVIRQYSAVHLGFAVDTERGLLTPVIRNAHTLSLRALAEESSRLQHAIKGNKITPDELSGATFTVSNLGSLGIETFNPIINPPQVAILGVGSINLKPVQHNGGDVQFIPHLHLSLTIDHRMIDGAPGARFLRAVTQALENIDLWLAR